MSLTRSQVMYFFDPKNLGVYVLLSVLVWSFVFLLSKTMNTRGLISVTGVAYQNVQSDKAELSVTVSRSSADKKVAVEQVQKDVDTLKSFMENTEVKGEVATSVIQPYAVHRQLESGASSDEVIGYKAEALITMKTDDVLKMRTVQSELASFVLAQDMDVSRNEVSYLYSGLEDLKIELLNKAIKNAKERAKAIGKESGTRIGKIKTADQGTFQINPANDFSVSDYGNFDTSSLYKTIRATVGVDFHVN